MDNKLCPRCASTNTSKGTLQHSGSVLFVPQDQKGIYINKSSGVTAYACKDCGCVFDWFLKNPENI